jgi:prepilin-type processing-associated H-X9-DG protein
MSRRGLRIAEVLAIVAVLVIGGLIALPMIRNARFRASETKNRTLCASHLKQWASVLAMYADESKGERYPPISARPTVALAADLSTLYPKYLGDLSILTCPSDVEPASAIPELQSLSPDARRAALGRLNQSYIYLGWVFDRMNDLPDQCLAGDKLPLELPAIWDKLPGGYGAPISPRQPQLCAQMTLTVESVFKQADAADADAALVPPNGNMGGKTVYRLGKGVGRLLTTDTNAPPEKLAKTNAEIPVMLDVFTAAPMMATFNHIPGGSNVLFLDGHVAFYKYPGTGPVSRPVGLLFGILETIKRCTP